eukprot:106848_1
MDSFNNMHVSPQRISKTDTNLSKQISRYQFATNIIDNPNNIKYTCVNLDEFNMPFIADNTTLMQYVYVKPLDNSFEYTKIKSFTIILPKYKITDDKPLSIGKTINVNKFDLGYGRNGIIQILCSSDIIITKNG